MSDRRLATEADLIRHLDGLLSGKPARLPDPKKERDWLIVSEQLPLDDPFLLGTILTVVADITGIRADALRSVRRAARIVRARQIFCKVASTLSTKSIVGIGRFLGRDHSTILYSIKEVDADPQAYEPDLTRVYAMFERRKRDVA